MLMKALRSWKTTLASLVAGLSLISSAFGNEGKIDISQIVTGVGVIIAGAASKDNDVTGGDKQQ